MRREVCIYGHMGSVWVYEPVLLVLACGVVILRGYA